MVGVQTPKSRPAMVEAWKPGLTPWVGEVDAPAPAADAAEEEAAGAAAAALVATTAVVAAALLVT
jgi:hypothetical protein